MASVSDGQVCRLAGEGNFRSAVWASAVLAEPSHHLPQGSFRLLKLPEGAWEYKYQKLAPRT